MAKKWYVFDEFDCFETCDTVAEAAEVAGSLAWNGFTGIEIRQFSLAEFMAYCKGGERELNRLRSEAK